MSKLIIKRSRLTPNTNRKENKGLFLELNIVLIIGSISLISTGIYLIKNLGRADENLIFCLPAFIFGLALMILYGLGYQRLLRKR